ncbi:MAG: hypothetical protein WBQ32_15040, partial [Ignavibacteriaceae bacterium]
GSLDLGVWVFAVGVGAGISHLVQSSSYEFQRQMYDYWVYGKESARFLTSAELREKMEARKGVARLFARFYLVYQTVQRRFSALDEDLFGRLEALKQEGDPAFSRARDLYRSLNVGAMRRWSLMSNNPRTIAIFLACILGLPVLYFLVELTVMNVLFIYFVHMQRARYSVLKARLSEIGDAAPSAVLAAD